MIVRTLSETVALALGFNVGQVFFGRSPLLGELRAAAASALPRSEQCRRDVALHRLTTKTCAAA